MKSERYDVVVIGSGMGGLSAAALLSHAGFKTLVVEKQPIIGGRNSTIEHKGFKISTGAMGQELVLEDIVFKKVGAPFNVRVPRPNSVYYINGKVHEVPEKGKLRTALTIASGEEEANRIMKVFRRAVQWQEPSDSMTFGEWLRQFTQNDKALGVFRGSWDTNVWCAGELIREIRELGPMPYGYAVGGNITIMESLASAVRTNGGEVWIRCRAKQIIVDDGVAKGVVVERCKEKDEVRIACGAVISNAGPKETVRLGGSENFDKGYIKDMRETLRPFPWLAFQISSNRPLVEHEGIGFVTDARRVNWIICPTILCPELAPSGKHLLYAGSWLPPSPPYDLKKELELSLLDVRELVTGYDKCAAEILHVGYWLKGWPMSHTCAGHYFYPKTSIENLYNVGDGVVPPGHITGLEGCAMSARVVVDDLKKRMKPSEIF